MARPLRLTYEGAVYHVTARGNARGNIFETDGDRRRYLFCLAESLQRYDVRLFLFCLMTNHVHLVLETPLGNLSQFMQRLQTAYTVWFNRKHQRSGHLFQGRYGACLVGEDEYILKLSRYVHLNPVFVAANSGKPVRERIGVLRSYSWSSYRSYIGMANRLDFVAYEPVLALMDSRQKRQASVYRRFVEAGIVDIDATFMEAKRRSRFCLGSEDYLERVAVQQEKLAKTYTLQKDLSFQQRARRYSVDEVLDVLAEVFDVDRNVLTKRQRNSWLRPFCSRTLQIYCGLTQREIANSLSIGSGMAVGKQLRQLSEALHHDKELQSWWRQIERKLPIRL